MYENRPLYEERPVYTTVGWYECKKCGAKFDNTTDCTYHCLTVCDSTYTYQTKKEQTGTEKVEVGTEQVQVGTEKVQTGTKKVLVKEAYTSHDLIGYYCSCGAKK